MWLYLIYLPNLLGLHKLIDISILLKFKNKIKYFGQIENLVFEEIIVNFDKNLVSKSLINSDTLLYTNKDGFELILCLVNTGKGYYSPETFLVHPNDYYTRNQTKTDIDKILIKNRKNEVIKEVIHNAIKEEVIEEAAVDLYE